jgi:hypothetical protein
MYHVNPPPENTVTAVLFGVSLAPSISSAGFDYCTCLLDGIDDELMIDCLIGAAARLTCFYLQLEAPQPTTKRVQFVFI